MDSDIVPVLFEVISFIFFTKQNVLFLAPADGVKSTEMITIDILDIMNNFINCGYYESDELIMNRMKDIDVSLLENMNFSSLENIVVNSDLLIACHGAISHVAAAKKVKQIDIIDLSYNYSRWTEHFRNYSYINRTKFNKLSKHSVNGSHDL